MSGTPLNDRRNERSWDRSGERSVAAAINRNYLGDEEQLVRTLADAVGGNASLLTIAE